MHQLVYISTARKPMNEGEMQAVLAVSRANNARSGVTGLLVSGGTRFLQALEGPTPNVFATYERIQRDPRHFACVVLASRSVDARSFGEWSMAYENGRCTVGPSILDTVLQLTESMSDMGLQAEFRTFAELHAKAA